MYISKSNVQGIVIDKLQRKGEKEKEAKERKKGTVFLEYEKEESPEFRLRWGLGGGGTVNFSFLFG